MGYTCTRSLTPALEPFGATPGALLFCGLIACIWLTGTINRREDMEPKAGGGEASGARPTANWGLLAMGLALLPLALNLVELAQGVMVDRTIWEPIWLACFTGLSFYWINPSDSHFLRRTGALLRKIPSFGWVSLLSCTFAIWWFLQSRHYFSSLQLGFNDFGHFAQRIANTAAGRGMLLETPILPPFWDHFNPGLLALVPFWILWPDENLLFALQAVSLASSGIAVWCISRRAQLLGTTPIFLAAAFLCQPALGQMNVAYTYGWHPISLAIPLLLFAAVAKLAGRNALALLLLILAMSMEEGVIAMVAVYGCAIFGALYFRSINASHLPAFGIGLRGWATISVTSLIAFLLVYRFSGLAEFQTGRFVALGNSAWEVVLSPFLRPAVFWSLLFRWTNFAFLACLIVPCFLGAVLRSWTTLAAAAIPLGVLLIWDHKPATCLAFQYPSVLLPVLWIATVDGISRIAANKQWAASTAALVTAATLSLFVGQLPYSSETLSDILAATYPADATWRRRSGDEDSNWILAETAKIDLAKNRVLATGRIAAHLVGCQDVETIGQFAQRRDHLAELDRSLATPLKRYDWIVLDFEESFQQSPEQTRAVYNEAIANGFSTHVFRYNVAFLQYSPTNNLTQE